MKPRIAIVLGSTRPGRIGAAVAEWVLAVACERDDATYELIDLADVGLPMLDEAALPAHGRYANAHTLAWAETIGAMDGFVFVTAEYNHSIPGALKNAVDYLFAEWHDKAAGFVGYGAAGGVRAVEHLRLVMATLQVATVASQVALTLAHDFENASGFRPIPRRRGELDVVLDQVLAWSSALAPLRLRIPVTSR